MDLQLYMGGFFFGLVEDLRIRIWQYYCSRLLFSRPWVHWPPDNKCLFYFKKDLQLLVSRSGNVQKGTWEFIPDSRSVILDFGNDTTIYRISFLCDNSFLLLDHENPEKKLLFVRRSRIKEYFEWGNRLYMEISGKEGLSQESFGNENTVDGEDNLVLLEIIAYILAVVFLLFLTIYILAH